MKQDLNRLMERLRLQSIIQRLKRSYGDSAALAVLEEAIALEFRLNTTNEQTKQTRITRSPNKEPSSY